MTKKKGGLSPSFGDEFAKDLMRHAVDTHSGARRRWHLTRFEMYRQLEGSLAEYDSPEKTMLSVSRSAPLGRIMGLNEAKVEPANYPDRDITDLDLADDSIDFVVADQVLEHVAPGPRAAFAETTRVLRPGGIAVITTCLFNEIHQAPMDFWRFTPFALVELAKSSGMKILSSGGWGNREASIAIQKGFRKSLIPEEDGHPLFELATRNDPRHPIVTWVMAEVSASDDES